MQKIRNPLLTQKYTFLRHEDPEHMRFNAPHNFQVVKSDRHDEVLADIHFQEGPIKEVGVNGIYAEDLIAMVICRLEYFQKCEFACRENALAITKLEEALTWLRERTLDRERRNVEGTSEI